MADEPIERVTGPTVEEEDVTKVPIVEDGARISKDLHLQTNPILGFGKDKPLENQRGR